MAGGRGVKHRAAAPAVRSGWSKWCGRVEWCEAQGGCACCAVRGSKWVAGWRGVRHRAAAPAVRLGGQWSGGLLMRWLDIRKGNNDY